MGDVFPLYQQLCRHGHHRHGTTSVCNGLRELAVSTSWQSCSLAFAPQRRFHTVRSVNKQPWYHPSSLLSYGYKEPILISIWDSQVLWVWMVTTCAKVLPFILIYCFLSIRRICLFHIKSWKLLTCRRKENHHPQHWEVFINNSRIRLFPDMQHRNTLEVVSYL